MRTLANLGMSALLVGLFATFGCSGQAPGDPGTGSSKLGSAPSVAQKPEVKQGEPWRQHQRPELLEAALKLPSLTAEQRPQVQAEIEKVHAAHQQIGQAMETLRTAVGAAAKTGSFDPTAFGPQLDAMDKAAAAAGAARTDALVKLHDILTADQRKELVSSIRARLPEAGERPAFMRHGNWAGTAKADGQHCDGPGAHGFGMLRGLDLTDAQRQQIADLRFLDGDQKEQKPDFRARFAEHRAALDKMLTAFESDTFSASSVPDHAGMAAFMRKHAEHRIAMLAKVLPILDANQRAKLVERIDNPELMRPMMHRMMGGAMQHALPSAPAAPETTTPMD